MRPSDVIQNSLNALTEFTSGNAGPESTVSSLDDKPRPRNTWI